MTVFRRTDPGEWLDTRVFDNTDSGIVGCGIAVNGGDGIMELPKITQERKFENSQFQIGPSGDVTFIKCRFQFCTIGTSWIATSQFIDCEFVDCTFATATNFHGLSDCYGCFLGCELTRIEFANKASGLTFSKCKLQGATFWSVEDCRFEFTAISESNLFAAKFERCHFHNVDVTSSIFSSATRFNESVTTLGLKVHRHQLEYLSKTDTGGITPGQLADMEIVDDLRDLKMSFGGYWRFFHWAGLALFLYPYFMFFLVRLTETAWLNSQLYEFTGSNFSPDQESLPSISLGQALTNFFLSGGSGWKEVGSIDYWWIVSSVSFLLYNISRGILVWKAMQLEAVEDVTGIAPLFSVNSKESKYDKTYIEKALTYAVPFANKVYFVFSYLAAASVAYSTCKILMIQVVVR